jgi:hypothetical protein
MNHLVLPPEIAQNAPAILEYSKHWLATKLEGEVGNFAFSQIKRALRKFLPDLNTADPKELFNRLGRVEAAVQGLADEVSELQARGLGMPHDDEMREPKAQDFVKDAFAAAMETPNPEKQEILGRLIAGRLYAATESTDELQMRQALTLLAQMNAGQLKLLATLCLVQDPPVPDRKVTRGELAQWFDAELLPPLISLDITDPSYQDLEYLVSIGAATYSDRVQQELYSGMLQHAQNIERKALVATEEYVTFASPSPGEFYKRAIDLHSGKHTRGQGIDRIALGPYVPTAAACIVAAAVVENVRRRGKREAR